MTDGPERLRALERRFEETRSPEDEARWLVERVRVGLTEESSLVLASRLGHPAAVTVRPEAHDPDLTFDDWCFAIAGSEREELATRAVIASATFLVTAAAVRDEAKGLQAEIDAALDVFEEFLRGGTARAALRERADRLRGELAHVYEVRARRRGGPFRNTLDLALLRMVATALRSITGPDPARRRDPGGPHDLVLPVLSQACEAFAIMGGESVDAHEPRVRQAVLVAIIPFLLDLERHAP